MAKRKSKRTRREESDSPHQSQPPQPYGSSYLPHANPPRPNRPLLILTIALFTVWLIFLAFVALAL